ncbi:MAG: preQ(1) synthase [bacterium]|nr:preQ(1) synthase [bacterium]
MAQAEGLRLPFEGEDKINTAIMESFPYEGAEQRIKYETDEFSAVCPYSGLPDYAKLVIEYIPQDKIVELKSLKYYIVSYRNVGIYQESATNRLFQDINALLAPKWLKVTTVYNTRGGIDATCSCETRGE